LLESEAGKISGHAARALLPHSENFPLKLFCFKKFKGFDDFERVNLWNNCFLRTGYACFFKGLIVGFIFKQAFYTHTNIKAA
jgi:hypothetical protein